MRSHLHVPKSLMVSFLLGFVFIVPVQASSTEWGYHGSVGPESWGSLDPSFLTCSTGESQSPIDIPSADSGDDSEQDSLPPLEIEYASGVELEVKHNGHTIEAEVPAWEASLTIGSQEYMLLQFHFHTPSEHLLDSEEFPIEMHLVHKASDGSLAVVGVFVELGDAHDELDAIFSNLPQTEDDHMTVEGFDLEEIVPDSLESYRYSGSLTTPKCSEGVAWNVLGESIEMSGDQIQSFIDVFSGADFPEGNRRPVQDLNGRQIHTDVDDD